jgi:tetraacyldisaccharide 4'-kinase
MTDRRGGGIFKVFKAVLAVLALFYGMAIAVRRFLYKHKIFETYSVPMKVISVGNITMGGTGKTPFVIALVDIMKKELGKEPAVLIRGYGWDESAMLKLKLPDTPILVGEDRVRSAHRAIKLYGSDTAILDDGFQYWELERDLEIVLVDSRKPFGNGCLIPRGVLRENKSALKRACIVALTKVDSNSARVNNVKRWVLRINEAADFIEVVHRPRHFYDIRKKHNLEVSGVAGKRVVLLSSIGDPRYFEETIKKLGVVVVRHLAFGDHYNYTEKDKLHIKMRLAEKAFDFIITTEKDSVKLARMSMAFPEHTLLVMVIEADIVKGKEILIGRLRSLYSS